MFLGKIVWPSFVSQSGWGQQAMGHMAQTSTPCTGTAWWHKWHDRWPPGSVLCPWHLAAYWWTASASHWWYALDQGTWPAPGWQDQRAPLGQAWDPGPHRRAGSPGGCSRSWSAHIPFHGTETWCPGQSLQGERGQWEFCFNALSIPETHASPSRSSHLSTNIQEGHYQLPFL